MMKNSISKDFKYWAFISYSHKDEKWARWLHKKLETYGGHKKLVGNINFYGEPIPKRVFPIFRDRDELPGASDLGLQLQQALQQSRFLIIICSPHAAQSKYVNEEIRFFKSLQKEKYVLSLIVAGEPHAAEHPDTGQQECFPEALKYAVNTDGQVSTQRMEPIAADIREEKDGKQNALLKILAGILGIGFDALKQRDQERQLRLYMMLGAISLSLLLIVSGLAVLAWSQRNEAVFQRTESESREYAALASLTAETDPAEALKHAISAGELSDHPQSRAALRKAIKRSHAEFILIHKDGVKDAAFSNNAQHLISTSGGALDIWDLNTARQANALKTHEPESGGHFDLITISPDGKRVAARKANKIVVWNIGSQQQILSLTTRGVSYIKHIDFSPDSSQLLEVSGASVRVHNIDSGEQALQVSGSILTHGQISPDGKLIAASSSDGHNITLWDKNTGSQLSQVSTGSRANSVEFSPDGKWLVATSESSGLKLWNLNNPEKPVFAGANLPLGPNESHFKCAHFSPQINALRLLTCGADGVIRVWEPARKDQLKWLEAGTLRGHQKPVLEAAFDALGEKLVSASQDGTARIWIRNSFGKQSRTPWQQLSVLRGHRGAVKSAQFSPAGDRVLSRGQDGSIRLWNTLPDREVGTFARSWGSVNSVFLDNKSEKIVVKFDVALRTKLQPPTIWQPLSGLSIPLGDNKYIRPMQFSPDDKTILAVGPTNNASLYDSATGQLKQLYQGHENAVTTAQFGPSGKVLITSGNDYRVKKWHVATGKVIATFDGPKTLPRETSMNPDGDKIASAWWNDEVWIFSDVSKAVTKLNSNHKLRYLSQARFSADGTQLRLTGASEVGIWNTRTWEKVHTIIATELSGGRVLLGTAEKYVFFTDNQGRIEVAPIDSKKQRFVLTGHTGSIKIAAINSDATRLINADKEGIVKIWDLNTGSLLEELQDHSQEVVVAKFSNNAHRFVTGSLDGTVRVYYSGINNLIELAKSRMPVLLQAK